MNSQTFTQYATFIALIAIGVAVGVSVANAPGDTNEESVSNPNLVNFDYISPINWDRTDATEADLNTYLGGDHTIEFGIVEDPSDENILYFASSDYEREPVEQNTVSIIRYQKDTYEFERIYKATYEGFEPFGEPADWEAPWDLSYEAHVLGYDNGKLALFFQDASDSPGPCAEPVILAVTGESTRHLVALDLEDPYGGFIDDYMIPQSVIDDASARSEACLDDTFGTN